jgi:hypothetical protein
MNRFVGSFATDPDKPSSPSPVLIGVLVPFLVLLLVVGIGLFIWRRRKRQAIRLASSPSSGSRPSFDSDSASEVGLGGSAASMGKGGAAAPEMTQRRKSGNIPVDPFAIGRRARLSVRTPSPSSSYDMSIPPDRSPVVATFSQYPDPGTYPAFAVPPDSSSEDHSSRPGRSTAYHYEASTETLDPPSASFTRPGAPFTSPPSPTTEQSYHTALREERGAINPTHRLSGHESLTTPRKSSILRFRIC